MHLASSPASPGLFYGHLERPRTREPRKRFVKKTTFPFSATAKPVSVLTTEARSFRGFSPSWTTYRPFGMIGSKGVQVSSDHKRKCPCFGVFCFLCALIGSLFGSRSASADVPLAAVKTSPLVTAPVAVLGMTNPHVVAAAAAMKPEVVRFTFSQDLIDFANRVEKLARDGVVLNQRKPAQPEKLNLLLQSRLGGGVLQLCYRR